MRRPLVWVTLTEQKWVILGGRRGAITDSPAIDDDLAGYFTPEEWAQAAHDRVTWDDVRQALSKISGSLSDTVIAQRQER